MRATNARLSAMKSAISAPVRMGQWPECSSVAPSASSMSIVSR